jgi:hypothetical protein
MKEEVCSFSTNEPESGLRKDLLIAVGEGQESYGAVSRHGEDFFAAASLTGAIIHQSLL